MKKWCPACNKMDGHPAARCPKRSLVDRAVELHRNNLIAAGVDDDAILAEPDPGDIDFDALVLSAFEVLAAYPLTTLPFDAVRLDAAIKRLRRTMAGVELEDGRKVDELP
jgi:hypothetical protein